MHPEIAQFPNQSFYGGNLENGANVKIYGRGPLNAPYIVVDVDFGKEEFGPSNSCMNRAEADMLYNTAKHLGQRGGEIVALSFYTDQVHLLQKYANDS